MRAAVITAPGGPDVLAIQNRAVPEPARDEVCVRVRSSALNRADLVQRAGGYPAPPGVPADIPGLEYAGEIAALGADVRDWQVGDRVFGLVPGGAHAEYLVTPAATMLRVPASLAMDAAGALPEACITAHDALRQASFRAGQTVLIHAVGSGVGLAAVQIVRALGGIPYGTARSDDKLTAARQLGMEAGFVPTVNDAGDVRFAPAVLEATDGRGVDVILDLVGGDYVSEDVSALAPLGHLVLIGLLAGASATIDLRRVLTRRLNLHGTVLRSRTLPERIAVAQAFRDDVLPLIAAGRVRATIDRTMPLADIAEAHALLGGNTIAGKIALSIG